MSFQLLFTGDFAGDNPFGSPLGEVTPKSTFTLPYHVYNPKVRIEIGAIAAAYDRANEAAKGSPFNFQPIAQCWEAVHSEGLRVLRCSEDFDALLRCVEDAVEALFQTSDYRTSLLKTRLTTFRDRLRGVARIEPRNFLGRVQVGNCLLHGPTGVLEDIDDELNAIAESANETFAAAQAQARAAAEAILAPAREKCSGMIRDAMLKLAVPRAEDLASQYGWGIERTGSFLRFTKQVGGKKKTIELPLPTEPASAAPNDVPALTERVASYGHVSV